MLQVGDQHGFATLARISRRQIFKRLQDNNAKQDHEQQQLKSENAQLKRENAELKAAVKSQAELLTQLTESKEAFVGNDTTGDDAENSATLIIGDSIIKDLKDLMLNTFSSPRAQPEVVHFLISKESPYFSSCKSKISASNSL